MSILIKGMDMPKSCRTCPLNSAPPNGCLIWTINDIRKDKRNNDCPLIEIDLERDIPTIWYNRKTQSKKCMKGFTN